jgi:hypothetical protein
VKTLSPRPINVIPSEVRRKPNAAEGPCVAGKSEASTPYSELLHPSDDRIVTIRERRLRGPRFLIPSVLDRIPSYKSSAVENVTVAHGVAGERGVLRLRSAVASLRSG